MATVRTRNVTCQVGASFGITETPSLTDSASSCSMVVPFYPFVLCFPSDDCVVRGGICYAKFSRVCFVFCVWMQLALILTRRLLNTEPKTNIWTRIRYSLYLSPLLHGITHFPPTAVAFLMCLQCFLLRGLTRTAVPKVHGRARTCNFVRF